MIQAILRDHVVAFGQRRNHTEIGHEAGGEQERALGADKLRQFLLERVMRAAVAGDEMRRPGAHAIARGPLLERGNHARLIRQPQIIVTAKRQQANALYYHRDALG
jgi:hypothetical protein